MSIPPTATVCARATAIGLYGTYMWATVQDNLGAALLVFTGTLVCAAGGLWIVRSADAEQPPVSGAPRVGEDHRADD